MRKVGRVFSSSLFVGVLASHPFAALAADPSLVEKGASLYALRRESAARWAPPHQSFRARKASPIHR
jgi:hypothetical protein